MDNNLNPLEAGIKRLEGNFENFEDRMKAYFGIAEEEDKAKAKLFGGFSKKLGSGEEESRADDNAERSNDSVRESDSAEAGTGSVSETAKEAILNSDFVKKFEDSKKVLAPILGMAGVPTTLLDQIKPEDVVDQAQALGNDKLQAALQGKDIEDLGLGIKIPGAVKGLLTVGGVAASGAILFFIGRKLLNKDFLSKAGISTLKYTAIGVGVYAALKVLGIHVPFVDEQIVPKGIQEGLEKVEGQKIIDRVIPFLRAPEILQLVQKGLDYFQNKIKLLGKDLKNVSWLRKYQDGDLLESVKNLNPLTVITLIASEGVDSDKTVEQVGKLTTSTLQAGGLLLLIKAVAPHTKSVLLGALTAFLFYCVYKDGELNKDKEVEGFFNYEFGSAMVYSAIEPLDRMGKEMWDGLESSIGKHAHLSALREKYRTPGHIYDSPLAFCSDLAMACFDDGVGIAISATGVVLTTGYKHVMLAGAGIITETLESVVTNPSLTNVTGTYMKASAPFMLYYAAKGIFSQGKFTERIAAAFKGAGRGLLAPVNIVQGHIKMYETVKRKSLNIKAWADRTSWLHMTDKEMIVQAMEKDAERLAREHIKFEKLLAARESRQWQNMFGDAVARYSEPECRNMLTSLNNQLITNRRRLVKLVENDPKFTHIQSKYGDFQHWNKSDQAGNIKDWCHDYVKERDIKARFGVEPIRIRDHGFADRLKNVENLSEAEKKAIQEYQASKQALEKLPATATAEERNALIKKLQTFEDGEMTKAMGQMEDLQKNIGGDVEKYHKFVSQAERVELEMESVVTERVKRIEALGKNTDAGKQLAKETDELTSQYLKMRNAHLNKITTDYKGMQAGIKERIAKIKSGEIKIEVGKTKEAIAQLEAKSKDLKDYYKKFLRGTGEEGNRLTKVCESTKGRAKFGALLVVPMMYFRAQELRNQDPNQDVTDLVKEVGLEGLQMLADIAAPFGASDWYTVFTGNELVTGETVEGWDRYGRILWGTVGLAGDVLAFFSFGGSAAATRAAKIAAKTGIEAEKVTKILPRLMEVIAKVGGITKFRTILSEAREAEKVGKTVAQSLRTGLRLVEHGAKIAATTVMIGEMAYSAYYALQDTDPETELPPEEHAEIKGEVLENSAAPTETAAA